jgi:predicted phosphoribosyltransferase
VEDHAGEYRTSRAAHALAAPPLAYAGGATAVRERCTGVRVAPAAAVRLVTVGVARVSLTAIPDLAGRWRATSEKPDRAPVRRFQDRLQAGRALAECLGRYAGEDDVIVLGLPRGGVPVAYEVARRLGVPLDVFVVRKLGVPGHEELAFGAIATGGVRVLAEDLLERLDMPGEWLEAIDAKERRELHRRELAYRGERPPPVLAGRVVVLVDDGLATGASMLAAVRAVAQQGPARIVVAVPVADPEVCRRLERAADEVVCVSTPRPMLAVGAWYDDFAQVSDEQVSELLARASPPPADPPSARNPTGV